MSLFFVAPLDVSPKQNQKMKFKKSHSKRGSKQCSLNIQSAL